MTALLFKELRGFLNSLIGYMVIFVFLITVGLFLWVFPETQFNILEGGYAGIDGLFMLAPWVFMFLIPAITMRSFSEEKKAGTLEILLTQPVSELSIILAKYTAGIILVVFSLLPTLFYFLTVYLLATPTGNVDTGAMWGSYFGLLFLASAFVAVGVFTSSLSDNQIISFILSMFICFFLYSGFDAVSAMAFFGKADLLLQMLGINYHYSSMSRGVIDTRDLIYFLSLSAFFILLTQLVLQKRNWS